ncbi:hypothetical protein PVBG_06173 [Plasmodium vivax Brazil I]|uniref:VIR protein n=1 Tax=Plasmodium vivax (strain Brazil I) TaxID=1033975 RepID=A0A0J9SML5_PLAV1|nr:hypothetical protein PVBG_06173 [Plasmodium vivax Brazil I]
MLINRMNNAKYKHSCAETQNYLHSIGQTNNETLKNIGCSLECGYTFLTATRENTLTDLCTYLNLWLDEQKRIHVYEKFNVVEKDWQVLENLWIKLKGEKYASRQCERQHEENNISEYSKRLDLKSYCINRDYFKRLFQSSSRSDKYKAQICKGFSDYTQDNYNKLIEGMNCIDKKNGINDYNYHISDDCTLYNIPKTFPKCNEKTKTIVDVDNSKKDIEKCESIKQVVGAGTDLNAIPVPLDGDRDGLDVDDHGAMNILAVSAGRPDELKDSLSDSTDLDLLSLTVETSPENRPSKSIYYAGLSASGFFFTSMVFKKENLRQTTNKHLAEQWLQKTSEYMDSNSENSHYNFPYHSMQN